MTNQLKDISSLGSYWKSDILLEYVAWDFESLTKKIQSFKKVKNFQRYGFPF